MRTLPEAARPFYPFEGRFLDLDGIRMHYLDEGAGEPLVMLHGNPSWSILWREPIRALRGAYRCIAPDHIGMGLSEKPGDARYPYTLSRRVDDIERLLEHLGLRENITLVLHDWGGMIGMAWAIRHPQAVKRLIVMNTAAFPLPKSKPFPWQLALTRTPLGALLVRGFNAFARGATRTCCTRRRMPADLARAFVAPYDSWANRIATLRFVQDIPLRETDHSYAIVREVESKLALFAEVPIQIFWGMRDFVFDKHFLAEWERHFPNAEVHRFEDGGHYILEDAHEDIVPKMQAFLSAHPLAAVTR